MEKTEEQKNIEIFAEKIDKLNDLIVFGFEQVLEKVKEIEKKIKQLDVTIDIFDENLEFVLEDIEAIKNFVKKNVKALEK